MKSSEISTANSTQVLEKIVLPEEIKSELLNNILSIKELLKSNKVLFLEVVKKCIDESNSYITGVEFKDISCLLKTHYPLLEEYKDGSELLRQCKLLTKKLKLQSKEIVEFIEIENEEELQLMHELLVDETNNAIYNFEINLSGDIPYV